MKLKKIGNTILQTIAGENKVGEALHGVLDLLPFPNQVIAKLASSSEDQTKRERKEEVQKLLSLRNGIAVAVFLLIVFKVITIADAVALLKALMSFV